MSDQRANYEAIRAAAEAADRALASALDERTRAVEALVALRTEDPKGFYSLARDADVLARVTESVEHFPKDSVRAVMAEVLSACQRQLAPIEVAYEGLEGGFGHLAARKHFGAAATLRSVGSAEEVLSEVERGHCSFGVVPFETSHDGAVTATLNQLARSDVKVCAEVPVSRAFHLLSASGTTDDITRVFAAAGALNGCAGYLRKHLPDAEVVDAPSGIEAAARAKRESGAAALGTAVVAEVSGLPIALPNIEDVTDRETRYVAVGDDYPPRTGADRTAVALALHDAPGVLFECLKPFADRKINLDRLETRPARGWEFPYLILMEVDGHITDRNLLAALEELKASSRYVKVLGSYPRVRTEGRP